MMTQDRSQEPVTPAPPEHRPINDRVLTEEEREHMRASAERIRACHAALIEAYPHLAARYPLSEETVALWTQQELDYPPLTSAQCRRLAGILDQSEVWRRMTD